MSSARAADLSAGSFHANGDAANILCLGFVRKVNLDEEAFELKEKYFL